MSRRGKKKCSDSNGARVQALLCNQSIKSLQCFPFLEQCTCDSTQLYPSKVDMVIRVWVYKFSVFTDQGGRRSLLQRSNCYMASAWNIIVHKSGVHALLKIVAVHRARQGNKRKNNNTPSWRHTAVAPPQQATWASWCVNTLNL